MDDTEPNNTDNEQFLGVMNVSNIAAEDFAQSDEQTPSPTVKSTAKRSKNFTRKEDQLLVQAWLSISMDATVGAEQNRNTYWDRIRAYFNEGIRVRNLKHFPSDRNSLSLKNRWQDIQKASNNFASYVAESERRNQSGTNPKDKLIEACSLYKEFEKKTFPFLHCWSLLEDNPKWTSSVAPTKKARTSNSSSPRSSSPDCSRSPIDLNDDISVLERPGGKKDAKRKAKGKSKLGNEEDAFTAAFENMYEKKEKAEMAKLTLIQEAEQKKEERFERAFKQEQEKIDLEKRKEDERIMAIDVDSLVGARKQSSTWGCSRRFLIGFDMVDLLS